MEPSKQYWEKRQAQTWANLERDEKALNAKLEKLYSQEMAKLEKEIAAYFGRYGHDNVIEYRDLLTKLSEADKDLLFRDYDRFAQTYPQYAHLAPVRDSIYKLDRLQGLEYSIRMQQLHIGAMEIEALEDHLVKTYGETYHEMAQALGFGKQFASVDEAAAKLFVNRSWLDGKNFSDRIWTNKETLVNYLTTDFRNAMIRGDNYQTVVNQMAARFGTRSLNNIRTLIYTEGTYVNNAAAMKPFEDLEGVFDKYEYVSVIDEKTTPICQSLNGQAFKLSEKMPGKNFPPMHPRCRSSFSMVIPRDFISRYKKAMGEMVSPEESLIERAKALDLKTATKEDVISLGQEINEEYNIADALGDKDKLKEIFSNFREMGGAVPSDGWAKGSFEQIKAQLNNAFSYYPKDWALMPQNAGRQIYARKYSRGFFFGHGAILGSQRYDTKLPDYRTKYVTINTDGVRVSTPFHEIGHLVQWANPDVVRIEKEFLQERTIGERFIRLSDLFPGVGYKPGEITKLDNFLSPYIGKYYDDATEVLSMGLEGIFLNKNYDRLTKDGRLVNAKITDDPDFMNLIIGLIVKG